MMDEIYHQIRELESRIYPVGMQSMQDCIDLEEYCESTPLVITWGVPMSGYLLATKTEIVDLASVKPLTLKELRELMVELKGYYKNKIFSMDARETTSYKLIKYAESRGYLEIISSIPWKWCGETFFELEARFK